MTATPANPRPGLTAVMRHIRHQALTYAIRPPGLPRLVHGSLFGHNVIWHEGQLYAVPHGAAFSLSGPQSHLSARDVDSLCFAVLRHPAVRSVHTAFIQIDSAFGYNFYVRDGRCFAVPTGLDMARIGAEGPDAHGVIYGDPAEVYDAARRNRSDGFQVAIHVGLPKTATTFLQRHVFPRLAGVHYVDWSEEFFAQHFLRLKFRNPYLARGELRDAVAGYLRYVGERTLLISDESLTTPWLSGRTFVAAAATLKEVFPGARIIMTVREQTDMLRSVYLQRLRGGVTLSPAACFGYDRRRGEFVTFDTGRNPYSESYVDVEYFNYNHVADCYANLFGQDNVHVLSHEQLRTDPKAFLAKLAAAVGTEVPKDLPVARENAALGRLGMYAARFFNILLWRRHTRLGILVEQPFRPHLLRLLDRWRDPLPHGDRYRAVAALNRWLLHAAVGLFQLVTALTVAEAARLADRLWYRPADPFSPAMKAAIRSYFARPNARLAAKYGVDFSERPTSEIAAEPASRPAPLAPAPDESASDAA